jgi:hypothetical protein
LALFCVVVLSCSKHGDEDGDEAVSDASDGAAMRVPGSTKGGVVLFGAGIVAAGDPGPVIDGFTEPVIAG